MKEKKLILIKDEESQSDAHKLASVNAIYEFLLRILMAVEEEIKVFFLSSKQMLEFVKLSESF